jgi:hypothetical protein
MRPPPLQRTDTKTSGLSRSPSRTSLQGYHGLEQGERSPHPPPSIGKLYLRLYNIGRSPSLPPIREVTLRDPIVLTDPVSRSFPDYRASLNSRVEVVRDVRLLVDTDPAFKNVMLATWEGREADKATSTTSHLDLRREEDRKLSSIAKWKVKLGDRAAAPARGADVGIHPGHYAASRGERARDLQSMDIFRER